MRPIELTILDRLWPLRHIAAITLWPFILYREGYRRPPVVAHERYHWHDQLRWGVLPWFIAYVVLAAIYRTGGDRHPLERKAYEVQREHESNS